jgi:hypothetical protein
MIICGFAQKLKKRRINHELTRRNTNNRLFFVLIRVNSCFCFLKFLLFVQSHYM